MILEIQFWPSLKYTVATKIRKTLEQISIPVQAVQVNYSVLM